MSVSTKSRGVHNYKVNPPGTAASLFLVSELLVAAASVPSKASTPSEAPGIQQEEHRVLRPWRGPGDLWGSGWRVGCSYHAYTVQGSPRAGLLRIQTSLILAQYKHLESPLVPRPSLRLEEADSTLKGTQKEAVHILLPAGQLCLLKKRPAE